MDLVVFNKEKHFEIIKEWGKARGTELPPPEYFADIGLMVPGIGAAFLYTTNSKQCILDNIIINPAASFEDRASAAKLITEGLVTIAKDLGYWLMIGQPEGETMLRRSLALGFEEFKNFTMVRRWLRENK